MNTPSSEMVKTMAADGAKASPLLGYWGAVLSGMTLADWATLAALVYSLILIFDKLKQMGVFRFISRRVRKVAAP